MVAWEIKADCACTGTFVRRLGEGPSLFRKGDKTLKQAVKDVFTYNWKWAIAMVVNQYGYEQLAVC
jgi:hypothetical protein